MCIRDGRHAARRRLAGHGTHRWRGRSHAPADHSDRGVPRDAGPQNVPVPVLVGDLSSSMVSVAPSLLSLIHTSEPTQHPFFFKPCLCLNSTIRLLVPIVTII